MTITKTAAREAVQTLQSQADALATQRLEADARHRAESERISAEQNAIAEIQRPLNELLQQRRAILERIACATTQLARQTVLQGEWLALVDQAVGVRDAMHLLNFQTLWNAYGAQANAARVSAEIGGFISRRKAELGNLEASIKTYASQHSLEYLVPVDMGGQAPE